MSPKRTSSRLRAPLFSVAFTPHERALVDRTLRNGWVTTGAMAEELERRICQFTGAKHGVAVSSATAGLHLALVALGISSGDEVIVPSYTFTATASAALHAGARPVFCDINAESLTVDPNSVARCITRKTRAVIVVDLAGAPCDYAQLAALCRKHNLRLICDAAHSLGASYRGRGVGVFGDATVFSFYSTKNITTGEGGMVVTSRSSLAKHIRQLSLHGLSTPTHIRNRTGQWRYDVTMLGYKCNLSDLNAALGVGQMDHIETLLASRERAAERYLRNWQEINRWFLAPSVFPDSERVWHLFIARVRPRALRVSRDRVIKELRARGVGAGVHYIPLHQLTYFSKALGAPRVALTVTASVAQEVFSLPMSATLSVRDCDRVIDALADIGARFGRVSELDSAPRKHKLAHNARN